MSDHSANSSDGTSAMAPPENLTRPSLSRKRRAANRLPALEQQQMVTRAPSSLSLSSDGSLESGDDDLLTDVEKRGRFDSLTFGDDGDILPSLQSSSDFSSTESLSCNCSGSSGRIMIGGKRKDRIEPLANNSIIGEYRIVGAGRDACAVNMVTNEVFHCQVLTRMESTAVSRVISRLDEAEKFYHGPDINELKELVFPRKNEVVEEMSGRMVMFTPKSYGSLHSYAYERSQYMTEADVQPLFKQIVRILAFCHSLGIIVRNMKPRKLVFDDVEKKRLRLDNVLDCVVCDDPVNDTIVEKICTPAFAPPEVVNRYPSFSGHACDVWGLGVLLYLLLLGRYPFYDKTPAGVFQKIKSARVVIPPNVHLSGGARALIYGLLRREPVERPTANELRYIPWICPPRVPCRLRMENTLSVGIPHAIQMRISMAGLLEELTEERSTAVQVPPGPLMVRPIQSIAPSYTIQSAVPSTGSPTDALFASVLPRATMDVPSARQTLENLLFATRSLAVAAMTTVTATTS